MESFPHVARPGSAIDACLSIKDVVHSDPELLLLLCEAFCSNGAEELLSIVSSEHNPKAQRVIDRVKILSPEQADSLSAETRAMCIPLSSSRDLALRCESTEVREVRVASKGTFCIRRQPDGLVAILEDKQVFISPPTSAC